MKYIIYFVIIVVLVGIQVGVLSYITLLSAAPDLLLLFVVGVSLQRETEDSFFVALLAGLFLDFLSGLFVGSFTFAFLIVALLLYIIIHRLVVFELSWKYLIAVVVVATVFTGFFSWAVSLLAFHYHWSGIMIDIHLLSRHLPYEIIYNALLAYPVYMLAMTVRDFNLKLQGKKERIR